ncbi:MAG: carbamoyltransferase HypF [Chloroflexota bacterium]
MAKAIKTSELWRIAVRGVVQGVGFRPFIYRLAHAHNLAGWVCNTSGEVQIEVEGKAGDLARFLADLKETPPPQAHIGAITVTEKPSAGYRGFEIRPSLAHPDEYQLISPDLATCPACRKEIFDESDRRYRYPFTNCTNCGPRFTIIRDIPYDRPLTTMRRFKMCPACQAEYDDPLDRRFHAQPNACPVCGPSLELADVGGNVIPCSDVIARASELLRQGNIVAVRGLGGFLLACDATDEGALRRLKERKRRPDKPLAVMMATLAEVREHCRVSPEEAGLLTSPQCPIVLLQWKPTSSVTPEVAAKLKYLGVMLPYTPLHHLLLADTGRPLVMTSGNLSEEPIAKDNDEAVRRLAGIADYFLLHNRDIYSRYDDSVVVVEGGQTRILRRARGYAPHPVHLPGKGKRVLACGAELKGTFCLSRDDHAFISQHIGDMENLQTLEHFENTTGLYQQLFRIEPEIMACDMHPDYLSTKWAKGVSQRDNLPLVPVQHHHAHAVSCLADNGVEGPVIGVSLDGTGYGTDGHIWGGEFLVADYLKFQRRGHLEYLPLPGGDAATKKPYRIAIAYLYALLGEEGLKRELPCYNGVGETELGLITRQIDRGINTPLTSSCGRLFDAVSALVGVRGQINYEAQAAIEMEMLGYEADTEDVYPFAITMEDGVRIIRVKDLFGAIIADVAGGVPAAVISAKFHNTVARMVRQMCARLAEETGIATVALSGGVCQNRLLMRKVIPALEAEGLTPLVHSQVPCNDGGISLGQAVIARAIV